MLMERIINMGIVKIFSRGRVKSIFPGPTVMKFYQLETKRKTFLH